MLRDTRSRVAVTAVAAVAVLLAILLPFVLGGGDGEAREGVADAASSSSASSTTSAGPTAAPSRLPVLTARRTGSVDPETPLSVRLPSGRVIPVRAVSSRPDGSLDVPIDIDNAGWFRGGSRLGDPFGSTLLAAHVDSLTQGLGPFEELLGVREGGRVVVGSKTLTQTFRISSLRLIPQGSLRDDGWIYAPSGSRRLVLVTCAPPYDRGRGGYQNLAVVTATPVADAAEKKG